MLRLKGKGAPGHGTGGPGDALIEIEVLPDPRVTRARVRVEKPQALAPHAAAAGVEITVVRG